MRSLFWLRVAVLFPLISPEASHLFIDIAFNQP